MVYPIGIAPKRYTKGTEPKIEKYVPILIERKPSLYNYIERRAEEIAKAKTSVRIKVRKTERIIRDQYMYNKLFDLINKLRTELLGYLDKVVSYRDEEEVTVRDIIEELENAVDKLFVEYKPKDEIVTLTDKENIKNAAITIISSRVFNEFVKGARAVPGMAYARAYFAGWFSTAPTKEELEVIDRMAKELLSTDDWTRYYTF